MTDNFRADVSELKERIHALERREALTKELFDTKIENLRSLIIEKLNTVELRFTERDLRFTQATVNNQRAIEAAQAAVSVASEKNEKTFTKQIDGITAGTVISNTATEHRVSDLKDRMTMFDGRTSGASNSLGWVLAVISAAAAIVSI